ncbi:MAG: hypothetical protein K2M95_07170 [Clostridiales bacterium]|nr:hypothetical protein [Clostridiales bacterium]
MRKKAFLVLTLFFSLFLFGCGGGNLHKYESNISELREHLFAAESAGYKITAVSGVREDPYEMDGRSEKKRAFTVVTVIPAQYAAGQTLTYRAECGDKTFEGDLLPHPFAAQFSVDLPFTATEPFSFTVIDKTETSFTLEKVVTGDAIGAEKALTIALEKLKKDLARFKSKGKLHAEIYVRLIENTTSGEGGYFWYVAFVSDADSIAVLLHADTGAVAATRV